MRHRFARLPYAGGRKVTMPADAFEPWTITENIARFEALLDVEVELEKRKTLIALLAAETAKLGSKFLSPH